MRYIIELAYRGTNFHGWQRQPNAITVQESLEDAMTTLLREQIVLTGCGRTDTGVHAKKYYAHFDSDKNFNPDEIVNKLNSIVGNEIAVCRIEQTHADFHARFDAVRRIYHYRIMRKKSPFDNEYSWLIHHALDVEAMQMAANKLFDYKDFTSFSKLHTDVATNNCEVYRAEFVEIDNELIFIISADRFLRNMVRAIIGTLVDVGRGKITVDDFAKIIEQKNRCTAGQSAPAQGLSLFDVVYKD